MKKPILSICIPTYNRAEYLKNSIQSIISQEEFKDGQVEIVISDNASSDETEDIVRPYAKKYKNIIYFRNEKNINNDNFPFVLSKGNGTLRKLSNDTLCFEKGALKYICDIVKKYEQTKPYICWLGVKDRSDIEELNFRNGLKNASYRITAISSFSVWDQECIEIERDTRGAELLLWQVRKALELASAKDNIVLVKKRITNAQAVYKKDISYGLYHVFFENYFTLLNPYFENGRLTEEDKEYLERDLLLNFFPDWCVKWKLQNTTLQYSKTEDLCEKIYQQFHTKPYWSEYEMRFNLIYWKLRIKEMVKNILGRG